jgi:hypothetical protein
MKSLSAVLALACLLFAATPAMAQGSGVIGIYFDEEGTEVCRDGVTGDVYVYVVVKNDGCPILSLECHMEYDLPAGAYEDLGWEYNGDGSNFLLPPDFILSFHSVLAPLQTHWLARLHLDALDPAACVEFSLRQLDYATHPSCECCLQYSCGDMTILDLYEYSTGGPGIVAAQLNCGPDCSVVNENQPSWGAVKSLYR